MALSHRLLGHLTKKTVQKYTEVISYGNSSGNFFRNNSVFRQDWKDDAPVAWAGREFQTRGAATGNALSPSVERQVAITVRAVVNQDPKQRRESRSGTRVRSSVRYTM